jgi:diguanylate cyclase (GGDEF)-like protein
MFAWKRRTHTAGSGFSPARESAFQAAMDAMRLHRVRRSGLGALVVYSLFAITDPLILGDTYKQAWMIRFLVALPLTLACIFAVDRVRGPIVREVLLSSVVGIVPLSIAAMIAMSRNDNAIKYQAAVSLFLLFGNIMIAPRFRDALAVTLLTAAVLTVSMVFIAGPGSWFDWFLFAATAAISLMANWRIDQDQRRAFLASAREHERNEELSRAVDMLGKLSSEDPLTSIANRREFDRRLALEWGRARRDALPLALILVDVDFFKSYNDHYGHPAGDACLKQIAAILHSVPQRSSDLVARLGGEEFVVLLPNTNINDAAQLCERMREAILELNLPHAYSTVAPVISASFGVTAMLPSSHNAQSQLLENADAALYNAKKNGRNRVVIHAD